MNTGLLKKIASLLLSCIIILGSVPQITTIINADNPVTGELRVKFSHKAGFYNQSFNLVLQTIENADVYYTTDGSMPTTASSKYTQPVNITVPTSNVKTVTVSAIAVRGKSASRVYTRSYVLGNNVLSRFGKDVLVFSLTSDPKGLYDYNNGILVEGADRAAYLKSRGLNPQVDPMLTMYQPYMGNPQEVLPNAPANFNRTGNASERPVNVEVFNSNGDVIISQRAGIRVKGGFSRAAKQKSLELYARNEYGDSNMFLFPFFGETHSADGNLMHKYRRIRLRNGGSDRLESGEAMLRDELGHELFAQAGHLDYQNHTPAAVFLNGNYYGVAWLKSPRTEDDLWRKYGGIEENYETFAVGEPTYHEGYDDNGKITRGGADWENLLNFARGGLTDNARWEAFQKRIDVDNLLRYYAAQIYTHNLDWPNHNIEIWRYFPQDGEDLSNASEYLDGKWRFIAQDLESGWSIYYTPMWQNNNFDAILKGGNPYGYWNADTPSVLLNAILARPEMKDKFVNTMVDLLEGAFSSDNVNVVINGLVKRIQGEIDVAQSFGLGFWSGFGNIQSFANQRPAKMLDNIKDTFGYDKTKRTPVSVQVNSNGEAVMNSRPVKEGETVTGNYYNDTSITVTAKPYPNYSVDYWTVNGVRQSDGESAITVDVKANNNTAVTVTFKRNPEYMENGNLFINELQAHDGDTQSGNWVTITNDTAKTMSTKGLFLSDSNNRFEWKMPSMIIRPGETAVIRASSNEHTVTHKRMQANFGITFGERLRLFNGRGNELQKIEVGLMTSDEVQRLGNDGKYRIVNQ